MFAEQLFGFAERLFGEAERRTGSPSCSVRESKVKRGSEFTPPGDQREAP